MYPYDFNHRPVPRQDETIAGISGVWATEDASSEAKELVGGFAIIQAANTAEAAEWIEFLAVAGDGECEVRQLWDQPS